MIEIPVDGEIHIPSTVPESVREQIRDRLRLGNPKFQGAVARARAQDKRLRTEIPSKLNFYRDQGSWLCVPRGAVRIVRDCLHDLPYQFVDERTVAPYTYSFLGQLRDYQAEAAGVSARALDSIAQLPCGAGKTWIGAGFIDMVAQSAAILVNSNDLRDQWLDTIYKAFGIQAGRIDEDTPIRIDTYQRVAGGISIPSSRIGALVMDEVHHVPAETFFSCIGKFSARYRLGLSATPKRDDGLSRAVVFQCGPIAYTCSYQQLFQNDWLMPPIVAPVTTSSVVETRSFTKAIKKITGDEGRNTLIRRIALREATAGRSILILSARKPHLKALARMISPTMDCEVLHGDIATGGRRRILRRMREGNLKILLATTDLAEEGLDLPRLERIIRATFYRARGKAVQCLGRLTRKHAGKKAPVLYDLVDQGKMPQKHWEERQRAYKAAMGRWYKEENRTI